MKSLLCVSFLIPASSAGYLDRQGKVVAYLVLIPYLAPGGVPMGSWGGLDLGVKSQTCHFKFV